MKPGLFYGIEGGELGFRPTLEGVQCGPHMRDRYNALKHARLAAYSENIRRQSTHEPMEEAFRGREEEHGGATHFAIRDAWLKGIK